MAARVSVGAGLAPGTRTSSPVAARATLFSLVRLLVLALTHLPFLHAAPVSPRGWGLYDGTAAKDEEEGAKPAEDPTLWIYLTFAVGLVLLGGAFAGLTIALMGQVRSLHPSSPLT